MPASADAQHYRVDAVGSWVDFKIRYLGVFSPGGRFHDVAGTALFDPDDWRTLAVAIRIPVSTLEARPAFWRDEILGPTFFDEAQHPAMLFTSTAVERTGAATAAVHGQLTLRATTLPVVLAAHITPDARGIEIDGEAKVSRAAFGLTGTLRLGSDEVTVSLHLRVVPAVEPLDEPRP